MFRISKSKISIKQSSMLKEKKALELGQEDIVRHEHIYHTLYNLKQVISLLWASVF